MACAVMPLRPVSVVAATMALTIASSVASIVRSNSRVISCGATILSGISGRSASGSSSHAYGGMPRLPVANASIRSPLYCSPVPPSRATASAARCASRVHWCGSSGASVATMTMIEPEPGS